MSLKKNVIANYLGQGWRTFMSLAFVPLYIKYMGMEAYGLIGIFAMLQAWLSLLDMGMKPALAREMALYTGGGASVNSIWDLLRSVELISFAIAVILAMGIWAGSGWLAVDWVRADKLTVISVAQAFSLMGVVTALQFVESIYTSCISGLQRQVFLNVLTSGVATVRGVGALVVLVWVSPSITAFFVWQAVISVISILILILVVYRILPPPKRSARFSMASLVSIWRYAAGMVGITLLSLLLTQVDKIFLSKMLSLEDFGFYALASVIAVTLYALVSPVTAAYYPRFVELLAKKDDFGLRKAYHQGAQLISVVMGSAAIVLMVNADLVVQLWVADYHITQQVAPLMVVLAFGTLINGLMWIPFQMQIAHGWTSLSVKIHCVSVVVIVPAIWWSVPLYGAIAAAWIGVALNTGYFLFGSYFMYRRILSGEKWLWLRGDLLIPLAVATIVAIVCRIVMPDVDGRIGELLVVLISSLIVLMATAFSVSLGRVQLSGF